MLSVRDSVEPADSFEDDTLRLCSETPLIDEAPIVFDLPSTISSSTATQARLSKSTKRQRNYHSDNCITVAPADISDFPTDFHRQTPSAKRSAHVGESPLVGRTGRRNSMTAIDVPSTPKRMDRAGSVDLEESPAIRRKRQKSAQRIEDLDDDDLVAQKTAEQGLGRRSEGSRPDSIEIYMDELVAGDTSPRKRLVAVEVPSKKQAKVKRGRPKKPLEEITAVENTLNCDVQRRLTPVPAPTSSFSSRPEIPPYPANDAANVEKEDTENVVLAKVPAKDVDFPQTPGEPIDKIAPAMPAGQPMNVATILAKSPIRPVYRVGLSRRVNIEPLHGYLKRKSS